MSWRTSCSSWVRHSRSSPPTLKQEMVWPSSAVSRKLRPGHCVTRDAWRDVTRCHAGKLHFSLGMNTGSAIIGDNTQAEVLLGPTCLVKALIFSGFLTVSYIRFFRITGTLDGPSFRKYLLSHCTSPLWSLHHWLLLKVHLGLGGQRRVCEGCIKTKPLFWFRNWLKMQ